MVTKADLRRLVREDRPAIALALLAVMSLLSLVLLSTLVPVLRGWGIVGTHNFLLTGFVGELILVPLCVAFECARVNSYSKARVNVPAVIATGFTAPPVIGIVLILRSEDGDPRAALALGCALGVVMWVVAFRLASRYRRAYLRAPIKIDDADDADHMIARCRDELKDPALGEEERIVIEVNLAGALIAASLREGHNELAEATEILERTLRSQSEWTYTCALSLVEAMSVKALRSGDFDGYDDALVLLLDAAGTSELPDARGVALAARGNYFVLRMRLAAGDGDRDRCDRLHADALGVQRQALELSRPGSAMHARHAISLAWMSTLLAMEAGHDAPDLDAAIKTVRRALRSLWPIASYAERAEGYLVLADLLTRRSQLDPFGGPIGRFAESLWPTRPKHRIVRALWWERGTHDILRAGWLCMRLSLRGGELAPHARARIPELTHLTRTGQLALLRGPARRVGWMYRQTFREQSRTAADWAVDLAEQWAMWAIEHGTARQAGEAHWCWINAVVAASRRRVFLDDKERRLSQVQGLAAQAGECLLAAGRPRDAAVAMDLGRAILLTERMQREGSGLESRLREAARADLADRWCDIHRRMSELDRIAFGASDEAEAIQTRFASAEHVVHADHERLLHEIGELAGFEDVDASPTYDDLRAAARDGPLVYLSATQLGGSAIIVTDAQEPAVVALESLRHGDVVEHAAALLQAEDAWDRADVISEQLDWLWEVVLAPLVPHLPPASLVTLICVGALSQLPIHASGAIRDDDGVWRDRAGDLVFRYVPNARVLLRAQAAEHAEHDGLVLSVAVADAPGASRLPRVDDESRGVAALFPDRTIRPSPPTVANVGAALDRCDIWHFACHGAHVPDEPLDSCLLLADGRLTLRAIFARPVVRRRLAVLSACQTALPEATLLDEVVNFPSALLQSGISGVVCAHAVVEDDAATLLVLGFFERVRDGMQPARALARAQAWLRAATNGELHDAFPDAYPVRASASGRALELWRDEQPFDEPCQWAVFGYWGR